MKLPTTYPFPMIVSAGLILSLVLPVTPCPATIGSVKFGQPALPPPVSSPKSTQLTRDAGRLPIISLNDTLPTVQAADSLSFRTRRVRNRLAGYADTLSARLDSIATGLQHSEPTQSPWGDTARFRLRQRLTRYQDRLFQLSSDQSPDAIAKKDRLERRLHHLQRQQASLPDFSEHPPVDQLPLSVRSSAEPYTSTLGQSTAILSDTTRQLPSGQALDQRIDQYAGQRTELGPLAESPAHPLEAMQESLQGYQPLLSGQPMNQQAVQQAVLERLQALGPDYRQEFAQRLQKATRKLARQGFRTAAGVDQTDTAAAPLGKRLRLGGNLQVQPADPIKIDLSPELRYALLPRWTVAAGGVYRMGIQVDDFPRHLFRRQAVYGLRTAGEWRALAGFSLRAEWERLRTAASSSVSSEQSSHQWVSAAWLGLVKHYRISRKVQGSVQLLYNLMHDPLTSPHPHPYVIRLGFQLQSAE